MIKEYRMEDSNEIISLQETETLQNYRIFHIKESDNLVKKIEIIEGGILKTVNYFIDIFEVEDEVVKELSLNVNRSVNIKRVQKINKFTLTNSKQYSDGILRLEVNSLSDSNEFSICFEYLDLITRRPIYERTVKFLYHDDDLLLEASYNSDGSLNSLMYMPDYDEQSWEAYNKNNFKELQQRIQEDVSYYWDATLLPK